MNTMNTQHTHHLPIAIIGAGPVGLAAAVHLVKKGETPIVLEAGNSVGAAVQEWDISACSPPGATMSIQSPPPFLRKPSG